MRLLRQAETTMRHQICITLDAETHAKIQGKLRSKEHRVKYRSKSHLIECAIDEYLRGGEDE